MLKLIDANCRIGNGPVQREGAMKTTAELLSLMDDFGVEKAVVYHSVAQYSDPLLGNDLLAEETADQPRFLRQWAVLPALWGLQPAPAEWVKRMRVDNVCSVRLFPAQYGHSLKRYAADDLMAALSACGLPVFIGFEQLGSWDAVYNLCKDYPENRFVLCGAGYRCLRYLVPVMNACRNLYFETGTFLMHNGLRHFCENMGADRLLYGSGAPDGSIAATVSQLLLSDISDEEKEMIASGNLARLLSEVNL